MLTSDSGSRLYYHRYDHDLSFGASSVSGHTWRNEHVYFVCEDEVGDGDWCIDKRVLDNPSDTDNGWGLTKFNQETDDKDSYCKVIAGVHSLAMIPEWFMRNYAKNWNLLYANRVKLITTSEYSNSTGQMHYYNKREDKFVRVGDTNLILESPDFHCHNTDMEKAKECAIRQGLSPDKVDISMRTVAGYNVSEDIKRSITDVAVEMESYLEDTTIMYRLKLYDNYVRVVQ